ncbi:MAG: hypothetical protein RMJ98_14725 [Myxococcales bacterium]|nr:hypothetical protein [Polyangiaceae bacterium]MDW8250547.1 hypothetical protein [Myxococcales bacterium]
MRRSLCWLPIILLGWSACLSPDEIPEGEGCRDIGYAIANKSFECDGDFQKANERYEDFTRRFACSYRNPTFEESVFYGAQPPHFSCSRAILQLPCEQIARYPSDDYAWWLSAADCGGVISGNLPDKNLIPSNPTPTQPPDVTFSSNLQVEGQVLTQPFNASCTLKEEIWLVCVDGTGTGLHLRVTDLTSEATHEDVHFRIFLNNQEQDFLLNLPTTLHLLTILEPSTMSHGSATYASFMLSYRIRWTESNPPVTVDIVATGEVKNHPCNKDGLMQGSYLPFCR